MAHNGFAETMRAIAEFSIALSVVQATGRAFYCLKERDHFTLAPMPSQ
jgi:hypothetical protein